MLDHRRDTDRRLDAVGSAGLLQRRQFQQAVSRARPVPAPVVTAEQAGPAVVDLVPVEPVELVRCPLCDVLQDRMWLFRHVASDHP